jgi:hypothetical protein
MFNFGNNDFKMGYICAKLEDISKGNYDLNGFIDEVNELYSESYVEIEIADVETILEFYTTSAIEDVEIDGKMYKKIWDLDEMYVYMEDGEMCCIRIEDKTEEDVK